MIIYAYNHGTVTTEKLILVTRLWQKTYIIIYSHPQLFPSSHKIPRFFHFWTTPTCPHNRPGRDGPALIPQDASKKWNWQRLPTVKACRNWLDHDLRPASTVSDIFGDRPCFTLWLCQNSYWKWPFIVDLPWFTHWKWWFSIAMLVSQRLHVVKNNKFYMVKNICFKPLDVCPLRPLVFSSPVWKITTWTKRQTSTVLITTIFLGKLQ